MMGIPCSYDSDKETSVRRRGSSDVVRSVFLHSNNHLDKSYERQLRMKIDVLARLRGSSDEEINSKSGVAVSADGVGGSCKNHRLHRRPRRLRYCTRNDGIIPKINKRKCVPNKSRMLSISKKP